MHREARPARGFEKGLDVRPAVDPSSPQVVRVLDDEHGAPRLVRDVRLHGGRDRIRAQDSVLRRNRPRQETREGRHARHLEVERVRTLLHQDFGRRRRQDPQSDLVGHRAARREERRRESEELRDSRLEVADGRVFFEDVVADRSLGHRAAHRRRRPRDGVAAQVDHAETARARAAATQPSTRTRTDRRCRRSKRTRQGFSGGVSSKEPVFIRK